MKEYELHLGRAQRAFKAFQVLKAEGLLEDAASRGYYAILHLARALLLKSGEPTPKTHAGLLSKLWVLRDRLGLSEELVRTIAKIQSLRERGDYGVVPTISAEELELIERVYRDLQGLAGESDA